MHLAEYGAHRLTMAIAGDLHVNSTVGLCPPTVRLDDGGTYHHSPFQAKLWEAWGDFWQQAKRDAGDSELIAVLNGDLVDGDHHRTSMNVSKNLEVQRRMALAVLRPVVEACSAVWIVRGTEAHAGEAGQSEEAIGEAIGAVPDEHGNRTHWRLVGDFAGVRYDITHHGPLGRLPWTVANALNSLSVQIELMYLRRGMAPPAFAIRSHNHQFADNGAASRVRCLALGAWQGITPYVRQRSQAMLPDIGGAIFNIEGGQASFRFVRYSE